MRAESSSARTCSRRHSPATVGSVDGCPPPQNGEAVPSLHGSSPPSISRASPIRFELATAGDDASLRELLRQTPMGGSVELAFLREPSYFAAACMQGYEVQTLVARRGSRVVGTGTRALRRLWVNGDIVDAGALSDLRLLPEVRGGVTLARGYRFLRELHEDGRARLYSTVIVADNTSALRSIAANRADLPRYRDEGRLLAPLIRLDRPRPALAGELARGSRERLPEVVALLNSARRQLAPVYEVSDFLEGKRFPGFRVEDLHLLLRDGRVAGVMGLWDQRSFRQTVPIRYRGWTRFLRPAANLLGHGLPRPGRALSHAYAAFSEAGSAEDLRVLLRSVYRDARARRLRHLTLGLHEADPRRVVLDEYPGIAFAGRIFSVTFGRGVTLDARVPFMDAATL